MTLFSTLYLKYKSTLKHDLLALRTHKLSQLMNNDVLSKRETYKIPLNADLENVLHCIDIYKQRGAELLFDADHKEVKQS